MENDVRGTNSIVRMSGFSGIINSLVEGVVEGLIEIAVDLGVALVKSSRGV